MALPHLSGAYTARKNIYEAVIVSKRNREQAYRQEWQKHAKFFNDYDVQASKQNAWESDGSFHSSMGAWKAQQDKESKWIKLDERRKQLAKLLQYERGQYTIELRGLGVGCNTTESMKSRAEFLKSAREDERQETARTRLYDHWRQNNPDIRQLESRQEERQVISSWKNQVDEQKRRAEEELWEKERLEQEMEEERQAAVRLQNLKDQEKLQEEKQLKSVLVTQIEELQQREKEGEKLKLEEEILMQRQWELNELEEEQKQRQIERKQKEHGRILLRQNTAALRRKTRDIKSELEQDRRFLDQLIIQEQEEDKIKSARREKAKADASWMKQVIEEQLKVEQAREAELDMLYQDEAQRVWQQREEEWSKERQARERLMKQVLAERQDQVVSRMEDLRDKQKESLERREELLQEMEMANQLTQRQLDDQKDRRKQERKELQSQITARQVQQNVEKLKLDDEIAEEKNEHAVYQDMLREEAQRLGLQGVVAKDYSRKKQAWI